MSGSATSAGGLPAVGSQARVGTAVRERAWAIAIWAAMIGWTAVLFAIVRGAYLDFRLGRFDLGNMVQAVWSTTEGRPLEYTHGSTGEQVVRLAAHVDPFLVLLAPLWLVWPSPLALALAQIAVTSLGALPVFWLGRAHLGSERAAGFLALGYLAYPWIATSAIGAIHPVTFAIPLLLFCVWFLDTGRLVPFAVCALLAMSTGELMGLPIAALGVWYVLARGRRRDGGLISLAGAAWTTASTTKSAARRRASSECSSPTRSPSSARSSSRTTSSTSSGSGSPSSSSSCSRPGSPSSACPSSWRTRSPTSGR
jgi:Predicted membrane protein (DUF2079)